MELNINNKYFLNDTRLEGFYRSIHMSHIRLKHYVQKTPRKQRKIIGIKEGIYILDEVKKSGITKIKLRKKLI